MYSEITIGLVSYLNSLPYKWAFTEIAKHHPKALHIINFVPSELLTFYNASKSGMFLFPCGALKEVKTTFTTLPYGIGCNGAVRSVCLFSHVPLSEVKTIYLDAESRTSNSLIQVLVNHFLQREIDFKKNYIPPLKHNEASLLIGDKALNAENEYPYVYDLGALWKEYTGMPFVFAQWVVKKEEKHQKMLQLITKQINSTLKSLPHFVNSADLSDTKKAYLLQSIKYQIDEKENQSIRLFQQLVQQTNLII